MACAATWQCRSWFPCRVCLTWLCAVLSVVAAGGTAAYQVSFKRIFGDSLRSPIDLGVFMAALGMQIFVVVGSDAPMGQRNAPVVPPPGVGPPGAGGGA